MKLLIGAVLLVISQYVVADINVDDLSADANVTSTTDTLLTGKSSI